MSRCSAWPQGAAARDGTCQGLVTAVRPCGATGPARPGVLRRRRRTSESWQPGRAGLIRGRAVHHCHGPGGARRRGMQRAPRSSAGRQALGWQWARGKSLVGMFSSSTGLYYRPSSRREPAGPPERNLRPGPLSRRAPTGLPPGPITVP
eukprot:751252-Hanusia_phi.AAC.1